MTRLTVAGLTKRFAGAAAVDGIDIALADGELVSLLGPSGCGKTTTLRCVAGFETPDAGAIAFDGTDVVAAPPERRDIGMVFQNYALFPHMTVAENLAFGLEVRRVPEATRRERIARVLDMVQLQGLEARFPRQLSGGQQQRVALARALIIEPRLLLLDEPLANLDAKLREDMRAFIRALQKRVGITTLYVTHDQAEAMVISDRVAVMFGGRVAQIDAPEVVYARPASRAVASFIGLSNFIAATVEGGDGAEGWRLASALGPLACRFAGRLEAGRPVTVLVRPEAWMLERTRPAGDANVVPGAVRERQYLGAVDLYRVACAGGVELLVQEPHGAALAPGAAVWCRFAPERAWLMAEAS
jgi:putative spermidine/putrescine transport system ATP-binding protein